MLDAPEGASAITRLLPAPEIARRRGALTEATTSRKPFTPVLRCWNE
jgi:hypothetical protein